MSKYKRDYMEVREDMSKSILTVREKEVFELLIKNKSTADIANQLNIGLKYFHSLYRPQT